MIFSISRFEYMFERKCFFMKNKCFRKIVALILSVCILIPTTIMYISAELSSDSSSIEVSGEKITLNLNFAKTYHHASGVGYDNVNYVKGKSLSLTDEAIANYNSANGTNLTIGDITALKVSTADNAYICGLFSDFIKVKLPQVEEIDMRDANVKTGYYSWSTDVEDGEATNNVNNTLPKAFFGSTSDTVHLTNIKKIILPETLEKVRLQCFQGLSSLETIEFGSNFKSLGNSAFKNCSSLKELNFPDSLNEFTHDTTGYIDGCSSLEKVSYHGDVEGAADKEVFYERLLTIINVNTVVKVDLSGSGIDSTMALEIANKAGLQSLDISDCANIEWISDTDKALYNKIESLISDGVTVKFTGSPQFGMMGDANNDGVVDIRDLVHIQSYIDGIIDEPINDIVYIDLEGDGIGDNELIIMRRALLDIESHDEYYQRINAQ